jgi:hypothetical protein
MQQPFVFVVDGHEGNSLIDCSIPQHQRHRSMQEIFYELMNFGRASI